MEDVGDTTSDEVEQDTCNCPKSDSDAHDIRAHLQVRKPIRRMSGRPVRNASRNVKYQMDDDKDNPPSNKRTPRKHHQQQGGLSAARIASQTMKSIPPKQTHPIPVAAKKPRQVETMDIGADDGDQLPILPPPPDTDEDNVPLSKIKSKLTAGESKDTSTNKEASWLHAELFFFSFVFLFE